MNNKVIELYKQSFSSSTHPKKGKTIGDTFYDYCEMKLKRNENRIRMINKLKRENKWKISEQ